MVWLFSCHSRQKQGTKAGLSQIAAAAAKDIAALVTFIVFVYKMVEKNSENGQVGGIYEKFSKKLPSQFEVKITTQYSKL